MVTSRSCEIFSSEKLPKSIRCNRAFPVNSTPKKDQIITKTVPKKGQNSNKIVPKKGQFFYKTVIYIRIILYFCSCK